MDRRRIGPALALLAAAIAAAAGWFWISRMSPGKDKPDVSAAPVRAVEFDRFSARTEHNTDGDRLTISLRLRAPLGDIPCYVFALARQENVENQRLWAIWPSSSIHRAVTASGQFHGADAASGYPLTLTRDWQRITAVYPLPAMPYDSLTLYVLAADGRILLSRPFRL